MRLNLLLAMQVFCSSSQSWIDVDFSASEAGRLLDPLAAVTKRTFDGVQYVQFAFRLQPNVYTSHTHSVTSLLPGMAMCVMSRVCMSTGAPLSQPTTDAHLLS
jgi:hypothetical protein